MIFEIFIKSKNPKKLFNFLSFLFDVESDDHNEEEICFSYQGTRFVLQEGSISKNLFSLKAESREHLDNLKSSVEFFSYKEGLKLSEPKIEENTLTFKDFEKRIWTFKV